MHAESTNHVHPIIRATNLLQEFSVPLIAGVVLGLLAANTNPHLYETCKHAAVLGHELTLHFIINGMFMCLFFGVATKEITQSTLPGGVLNPLRRAINPIVGTFGGVLGPAALYLALTWVFYGGTENFGAVANGWAIPTATDIALAWLAARLIFGASHPAVNFLLLLAVGDDAIGLGIIAIFYPDPNHPVQPIWLLLVVGGMASAYIIRRFRIRWWPVYILVGGTLSWVGLAKAGVEPALALVPIVPFLPHSGHAQGLFEEEVFGLSVLDQFEHQLKLFVDVGLFFFAFANAGVAFSSVGLVTMMVLVSLIVGKAIGVTLFSWAASLVGFPLPDGMGVRHLLVAGIIAGLGLTVALFVAAKAFPDGSPFQDPGKMGAVLSIASALVAFIIGWALKVRGRTSATETAGEIGETDRQSTAADG
ncbi:Na(+)/H(+) antiporter NhaA [Geodia barretti]|uniref:Na(+)/H(+) antiporter NhaA n=1 Tax=Geodia barretti TaxID=519541 RepID=A0AA35QXZ8_GEOBA|nr:Na(+)/H(+) antiporter NhaA [Geodia barretti]